MLTVWEVGSVSFVQLGVASSAYGLLATTVTLRFLRNRVRGIVLGFDSHFGKDRQGDLDFLRAVRDGGRYLTVTPDTGEDAVALLATAVSRLVEAERT